MHNYYQSTELKQSSDTNRPLRDGDDEEEYGPRATPTPTLTAAAIAEAAAEGDDQITSTTTTTICSSDSERDHSLMTSTIFWEFFYPSPFLCLKFMSLKSAKLGAFFDPASPQDGRHMCMPPKRRKKKTRRVKAKSVCPTLLSRFMTTEKVQSFQGK